ncbi:hypothetical protein ISN45_Aa01g006070 [Arabidopsis thaliana x Arabidopsis arenosa]|uniref:Uncharacterized protein n=1 Tax=Arabidopsis thaliana x Arabidopsis arenosa TaxID=1240361 RepID=A0A8T2BY87_9BRAS|nr:hypothetical protein ISN45_Aa01g006070 [Arabidopsis thaliana x Arabidopsis arenosa]
MWFFDEDNGGRDGGLLLSHFRRLLCLASRRRWHADLWVSLLVKRR